MRHPVARLDAAARRGPGPPRRPPPRSCGERQPEVAVDQAPRRRRTARPPAPAPPGWSCGRSSGSSRRSRAYLTACSIRGAYRLAVPNLGSNHRCYDSRRPGRAGTRRGERAGLTDRTVAPSLDQRRRSTGARRCSTAGWRADPDGEYLDVCGTKLTAAEVADGRRPAGQRAAPRSACARRPGRDAHRELARGDARLVGHRARPARSPCRSTPRTRASTCATSSPTRARGSWSSQADLADRVGGDRRRAARASSTWSSIGDDATAGRRRGHRHAGPTCSRPTPPPPTSTVRPSDLATFVYTGGTTGPSKGCMLSHNYHEALARQIGICWRRTADDVVWTPLPAVPLQRASSPRCSARWCSAAGPRSTGGSRCRTSGPR